MSKFEVEGLNALSKKLSALGEKTGSKTLRSALMQSSLPIIKEARNDVPKGNVLHKTRKGRLVAPGFASRNLSRKSFLSRDKRTAYVAVGVKREAFYAISFLELGTKTMPKRPWLVKAFESKKNDVVKRFSERLKKIIIREAKKNVK